MRITILGNSGSGKSTLAKRLADRFGVPLLYLDTVNFESGWVERDTEEKTRDVARFMENEDWVIEGNYLNLLLDERLDSADAIIILEDARLDRNPKNGQYLADATAFGLASLTAEEFADRYPEKTYVFRTRRELESFLESFL